ncbi:MAG: recombinase family protein [Pseudomonadota bacterium]
MYIGIQEAPMPRRSHTFSPGDPKKAVGYYLGPAVEHAEAAACMAVRASENGILLAATCCDDCPPEVTLDKRPGFADALVALWQAHAGLLLVETPATLSPDPSHQAMAVALLNVHGADLCCTAEGQRPLIDALRVMAEPFRVFYTLDRQVRIKAGMRAAKRTRRKVSRVAPYGYETAKDGETLVGNEAEQNVIRLVREMRAEGMPLRAIGARLTALGHHPRKGGAWAPQTISNLVAKTD